MEEFVKSLKAHLYERTTSPLFGTFVVSWVVWNYKFVMIVFSSMNVLAKFDFIENQLYPDWLSIAIFGIGLPLATSAIFIFGYPYPARFVYSFVRRRKKELLEERQKIEDETPLTREESRKIRRDIARLQLEFEKELEREQAENTRLRQLITEYEGREAESADVVAEKSDTSSVDSNSISPPDM